MNKLSLLLLVMIIGCGKKSDHKDDAILQDKDAAAQIDIPIVPEDNNQAPVVTANDTSPETTAPETTVPVAVPEIPANQFRVDASSTSVSAYFTLENGKLVASAADQSWLVAAKRTQFQTNSGTSGTLNIGVADSTATDYSAVTSCNAATFTYDEMLPASGAPGSLPYSGNALLNAWYNYDATTHVVSSKKLVYLISDGTNCFKFQILSYTSGVFQVLVDALEIPAPPAPPAPVVYEQTIDASSTANTVYLKLENGQLATTTVDAGWLFAVKRTQFQTNSGTSGTRGVGVYDSAATDFSALTTCSDLTYTYDAMLPASGAPGSQPYSGNAVLNAWYNYDGATHVVSSKQNVYALSDGTECLKLQILTYASGIYTVKISQL